MILREGRLNLHCLKCYFYPSHYKLRINHDINNFFSFQSTHFITYIRLKKKNSLFFLVYTLGSNQNKTPLANSYGFLVNFITLL